MPTTSTNLPLKMNAVPRWMKATIALLLLGLLAGGVWFYDTQKQAARQQAVSELSAIAQGKVSQIVDWRKERLADAAVLSESRFLAQGVARALADARGAVDEALLARLRSLQKHYHYADVLLVDPQGKVRLSLSGLNEIHAEHAASLAAALRDRKPVLTDLHMSAQHLKPHISVIAPIFASDAPAQQPLGAIIMVSEARQFLYPLIQSWPIPSQTAETLLVQRDGDELLYLNELRHQPNTAIHLRFPLTRTELPAVMAVLGRKGVVEGKDYRGVQVVSVLQPIPDSSWFMVAKVDTAEIYGGWRSQSVLILTLLGVLLGGIGGFWLWAWQRTKAAHYQAMFRSEAESRALGKRHSIILKSIGDAVIATDAQGRVELLNPVAEALTGWPQALAFGKPSEEVFRIVHAETRAVMESPVAKVLREGIVVGLANHAALIARDGTEHQVADSCAPIHNADGKITGAVLVFRDVSNEYRMREQLRENEEKYRTLFDSAGDSIFVHDAAGKILAASARACADYGYTQAELLTMSVAMMDTPEHAVHAPERIARLMEQGTLHFDTEHRRKDGTTIPLEVSARRIVWGGQPALLSICRDITERKRAEELIRNSQKFLQRIINLLPIRIFWKDNDLRFLGCNDSFAKDAGKNSPEDLIGEDDFQMNWKPQAKLYWDDDQSVIKSGKAKLDFEEPQTTPHGDRIWLKTSKVPLTDSQGNTIGILGTYEDITARKETEQELRKLSRVVEQTPASVVITDKAGTIEYVNAAFARLTGYSVQEVLGKNPRVLKSGLMPEDTYRQMWSTLVSGHEWRGEMQNRRKNGELFWELAVISPLTDAQGTITHYLAIKEDITARKQVEAVLLAEKLYSESLIRSLPGVFYLISEEGKFLSWNKRFEAVTGRSAEDMAQISPMDLFVDEDKQVIASAIQRVFTHGQVQVEGRLVAQDSKRIPYQFSGNRILVDGAPCLIGLGLDITDRKAIEDELRTAARTDRLTGLPNRALLLDRLQNTIHRHKRSKDSKYAVLFLDFDHFKTINDSLGHETGDQLLREIARRLQTVVRSVDSVSRQTEGNTTSRLGGDEFVILLDGLRHEADAQQVVERLLDVLGTPYKLGIHEVVSTASIGIVTSEYGHERAEDVLRDADTAMYEAKLAGRGRAVVFDGSMHERVRRKLELESGLRKALEQRQFVLHYQPIISLETRRLEGFEALVRWQHPEHGMISPGEFIPVAEDTGLIVPLGEWVFHEAVRQLAAWWRTHGRDAVPSLSINLSRKQMVLTDLPQHLLAIAQEAGVAPAALHLEVTESAIMADPNLAHQVLGQIKQRGFKIDMDDFGTGHSSLASLHQFPLDVLKIDRSFIANLSRGRDFAALVNAIAMLARNLNIAVVAEGVETEDQMTMLQSLECQMAQGYYFARPMPAEQVAEYLAKTPH